MSYIKLKTDRGVTFKAPLKTKADYQRTISLLQQEMSTLAPDTAARPVKKVKREPPGTAEFLEGVKEVKSNA